MKKQFKLLFNFWNINHSIDYVQFYILPSLWVDYNRYGRNRVMDIGFTWISWSALLTLKSKTKNKAKK